MTYNDWVYEYYIRGGEKNESLKEKYPEYFKRSLFNKEYRKAYFNADDEKIKSLKASNPEYFEKYLEEGVNNNRKNEKKYLSKFPIRFQRLITEGVLKKYYPFSSGSSNSKNSYKMQLPTSPIKNKQELLNFINDRQADSKLFINALGINENILQKNAQTIKQAILDKINEFDP